MDDLAERPRQRDRVRTTLLAPRCPALDLVEHAVAGRVDRLAAERAARSPAGGRVGTLRCRRIAPTLPRRSLAKLLRLRAVGEVAQVKSHALGGPLLRQLHVLALERNAAARLRIHGDAARRRVCFAYVDRVVPAARHLHHEDFRAARRADLRFHSPVTRSKFGTMSSGLRMIRVRSSEASSPSTCVLIQVTLSDSPTKCFL